MHTVYHKYTTLAFHTLTEFITHILFLGGTRRVNSWYNLWRKADTLTVTTKIRKNKKVNSLTAKKMQCSKIRLK